MEQFFNRKGDKKTSNHLDVGTTIRPKIVIKTRTYPSDILCCQVKDKAEVRTSENVLPKRLLNSLPCKKSKTMKEKPTIHQSSNSPKEEEFDEKVAELIQDEIVIPYRKVIEITERPNSVSCYKSMMVIMFLLLS